MKSAKKSYERTIEEDVNKFLVLHNLFQSCLRKNLKTEECARGQRCFWSFEISSDEKADFQDLILGGGCSFRDENECETISRGNKSSARICVCDEDECNNKEMFYKWLAESRGIGSEVCAFFLQKKNSSSTSSLILPCSLKHTSVKFR